MSTSVPDSKIEDKNLKIVVFLKDKPKLLANATITLNSAEHGPLAIKYWQIWKSDNMNERLQEKINVQPPSINMYGKYHPVIFFKDKDQFFAIEERIYDAYCLARNRREGNKPHNENVDPDEIDI